VSDSLETRDASEAAETEARRPNARYNLSRPDEPDREIDPAEIVYHYDRERRLEKAPDSVRDLYYQKAEPQPRRLRLLPAGPGGKFQLLTMIAILLVCAMALAITLLTGDSGDFVFEGNRVALRALRHDGAIIVSLRKTYGAPGRFLGFGRRSVPFEGPVYIEVLEPGTPIENASFHRAVFTAAAIETFTFAVPFDTDELYVMLTAGDATTLARIAVE